MRGNLSEEQTAKLNAIPTETVEEFLARGGKINKTCPVVRQKRRIDAQKLLNLALGTDDEEAVIKFLASQGIDVQ